MKRIIIIGNGFDRAHNLRTGYKEFIDDYWSEFTSNITDMIGKKFGISTMIKPYSDGYASLEDITSDNVHHMKRAIILPKTWTTCEVE